MKGIVIENQSIECPKCKCVMGIIRDSDYKRIYSCCNCNKKYAIAKIKDYIKTEGETHCG